MNYALDSNVYIEANRRYYAFDLAPRFWGELLNHLGSGNVVCIDRVQVELLRRNDQLANWVKTSTCQYVNSSDADTIKSYSQIMEWAQNEPRFTPACKIRIC